MAPSSAFIELRGVGKTYEGVADARPALHNVSLTIQAGEFVTVVGKSGSGKSTLLNLLAGLDQPTAGQVLVGGVAVHALSESGLATWRGRAVGVVFQFFQLLPTLTVAENVMLPMDFCNTYPRAERRPRALALLAQVGIADQADKLPAALSGGQQQRAAIARALANDPPLLVADEPTGNLDTRTTEQVMDLFEQLVAGGKTLVMVTHERDLSRWHSRAIELADGELVAAPVAVGQKGGGTL